MCGTHVKTVGSSPGEITGPEMGRTIIELGDQLKVQCLKETAVIPQISIEGSTGYDISATCSRVIPAKGKGLV